MKTVTSLNEDQQTCFCDNYKNHEFEMNSVTIHSETKSSDVTPTRPPPASNLINGIIILLKHMSN